MTIEVIGRKVNLKDSFKERVDKKLAKFSRLFHEDASATVTVTVEKDRQTVEVMIRADGMLFRAERTAKAMEEALDLVVDVLFNQIVRNKDRLERKMKVSFPEFNEEEILPAEEIDIVRRKSFSVKPMSVEEAILQMNMLGHQFFLYRDAVDNEINLVYVRRDGKYGVIVPE